jgi:signal transduction protein with GAF and PtsI domain
MTDLQTELNKLGSLDPVQRAEFTPDDLRAEIEKLQNKLGVSEAEIERERNRANSYLEKNQNITAGMFALLEPEILAAFTSMVDEAMNDVLNGNDFENAVESIVDKRVESEIEHAFDNSQFIDGDDVDERISDAIGDSSFDAAVRDVVREMINDGDIVLSIDVS